MTEIERKQFKCDKCKENNETAQVRTKIRLCLLYLRKVLKTPLIHECFLVDSRRFELPQEVSMSHASWSIQPGLEHESIWTIEY